MIGRVDDDKRVRAAEREVEHVDLSADALERLRCGRASRRAAVLEQSSRAFRCVRSFHEVFGHPAIIYARPQKWMLKIARKAPPLHASTLPELRYTHRKRRETPMHIRFGI